MRDFNYRREANRLLSHLSVKQIGVVRDFVGKKTIIQQNEPELYDILHEVALIHMVAAGVRGNGLDVPFPVIKRLIEHTASPQNEAEDSVVRYARALSSITNDEYTHESIMDDLLRLNSLLFYDGPYASQALWRAHNMNFRRQTNGAKIDFAVPPYEQAQEMFQKICEEYHAIIREGIIDPFFVIPLFFVDFIAIQPFDRGSFENSRLIVAYLMHWADYGVMDVMSLEHFMQSYAGHLFQHTADSLVGWHEGKNNYQPAFDSCMYLCQEAVTHFDVWMKLAPHGIPATKEIVKKIIQQYGRCMTKRMVMEFFPRLTESAIEMALYKLSKEGQIKKVSGGRYSQYIYVGVD